MTLEERKKIYAALAAPFPEEAIERTDGQVTGRGYNTVGLKWMYLVSRMNDVLGVGGWRMHRSVRTKAITTPKGRQAYESIADVTIELGAWIDGAFVAWADAVGDGGHVSFNEADSIKGSITGAVKRCCAYFGCGRQAYEGTLDDDNVPGESRFEPQPQNAVTVTTLPAQRQQGPTPAAPPVVQQPRPAAPSRNRLTSKQLAAIWAIGRKLGYEQSALRQHVKSHFGVQPEFLTRDQASQAIGALSKQAGNGHADEYQGEDVRRES